MSNILGFACVVQHPIGKAAVTMALQDTTRLTLTAVSITQFDTKASHCDVAVSVSVAAALKV